MTDDFSDVVRFHGHECPGAGLGTRIAREAVARLGRHTQANPLVTVSETDTCAVDAVQVLTGCTAGKRNLVHKDNGKHAFVFFRRGAATGVRIHARPGSIAFRDEPTWELAGKVEAGTATEAEATLFAESQRERLHRILTVPAEEILIVEELAAHAPGVRPLGPTEACVGCGEQTSVYTLHNHRGRMVCPQCHLDAHGGVLPPDHGHGAGGGHGHGHDHGDHAHPRAKNHTHAQPHNHGPHHHSSAQPHNHTEVPNHGHAHAHANGDPHAHAHSHPVAHVQTHR